MILLNDIFSVAQVEGVDQYILIDNHGTISGHDTKIPEEMADVVKSCMRRIFPMVQNRFKYIKFLLKNNMDLYVFPVGNYGLGVVKKETFSDPVFQENMIRFLSSLINGK